MVAAAADPAALAKWPVGTRTPMEGNTIAAMVQRSGRPARIDSYDNFAGSTAARVREVGVRAAVGVPIIVDGRVWGLAAVGSAATRPDAGRYRGPHQQLRRTDRDWPWWPVIATSRSGSCWLSPSRRANLIDALLEGRAFDERSLREVAGHLRLPINGPFVVIAAQAPAVGDEPLPEIESKLRSLDIFSAWRLLPDCAGRDRPRQVRPET